MMKLTNDTKNILRNFCEINQSLLVKKGNVLRTISNMKNILAEATITEEFPNDFAIYDLGQFLNGFNLHQDPDLEFSDQRYLTIKDNGSRVKYFYCEPSLIKAPPEKGIQMPSIDVEFVLNDGQLSLLQKASSIYSLPDLCVIGDGAKISLVVKDKKNDTSNEYSIVVGETDKVFEFSYKIENIRILPGSYEVVISDKLISVFNHKSLNLKYYIALEPETP
jgi:hypothetical protein